MYRYLMDEEKKRCKLYGEVKETIKHMVTECGNTGKRGRESVISITHKQNCLKEVRKKKRR